LDKPREIYPDIRGHFIAIKPIWISPGRYILI